MSQFYIVLTQVSQFYILLAQMSQFYILLTHLSQFYIVLTHLSQFYIVLTEMSQFYLQHVKQYTVYTVRHISTILVITNNINNYVNCGTLLPRPLDYIILYKIVCGCFKMIRIQQ